MWAAAESVDIDGRARLSLGGVDANDLEFDAPRIKFPQRLAHHAQRRNQCARINLVLGYVIGISGHPGNIGKEVLEMVRILVFRTCRDD